METTNVERPSSYRVLAFLLAAVCSTPFMSPGVSAGRRQDLQEQAQGLRDGLARIIDDNEELLSSPWLRVAVSQHLSRAEQAAKRLVADGHPNPMAVNDFHCGLEAFARALEDLPSFTPGTTGWKDVKKLNKPASSKCERLAGELRDLLKAASSIEGFAATQDVRMSSDAGAEEVRSYTARIMVCVGYALREKELEKVTGEGNQKTEEIMAEPLEDLERALSGLAATRSPGKVDTRAHAQAVKAVKDAMKAVTRAGKELSRYHTYTAPRVERMGIYLEAAEANVDRLEVLRER